MLTIDKNTSSTLPTNAKNNGKPTNEVWVTNNKSMALFSLKMVCDEVTGAALLVLIISRSYFRGNSVIDAGIDAMADMMRRRYTKW